MQKRKENAEQKKEIAVRRRHSRHKGLETWENAAQLRTFLVAHCDRCLRHLKKTDRR